MLKVEVKENKTKIQGKETNLHECLYAIHSIVEYVKSNTEKLTNEDIYKFVDMITEEMRKEGK